MNPKNVSVLTCFKKCHIPNPPDSIREATFTVSPKRQYLGILSPTTPATTGPVGNYIDSSTQSPYKLKQLTIANDKKTSPPIYRNMSG